MIAIVEPPIIGALKDADCDPISFGRVSLSGTWLAVCPSCGDRYWRRHLRIYVAEDGEFTTRCCAGRCSRDRVLEALHARLLGVIA